MRRPSAELQSQIWRLAGFATPDEVARAHEASSNEPAGPSLIEHKEERRKRE